MSDLNKVFFSRELKDFLSQHEDWPLGNFLYSIGRPQGDPTKTGKMSDFLHMTDDEILNRIEKAKHIEDGI